MYNPIFTQTIKSSFESVKAILLGDESCGKTSIALFGLDTTLTKNFKINQNCINFVEKKIKLSSTEKKIVLNLWDLTSSFIDNSFLEHVIPYTNIIFFVYDLTNSTSFDNLKDWLKIVKDIDKKLKVTRQYVLLANKSDLMHMKSVTSEKHQFFAFENEMSEYIVSGLSGDNINASLKKSVANFLNVTCTKDDLTNEVINTVAPIEVATKEDLVNEKMRASISMAKRLNREREMNDIASKICLIQ